MPPMMPRRRKSPAARTQAEHELPGRAEPERGLQEVLQKQPDGGAEQRPEQRAMPPIAVCITSWPEVSKVKASGGMKACNTPSKPPAKPA